MTEQITLNDIFAAQILILANQLKARKEAKGVTSTSDFIREAVRLVRDKTPRLLQELERSGRS